MKRIMLCSPDMPAEMMSVLGRVSGCESARIPGCRFLPTPVQGHPDMLFFNFPNRGETVVAGNYYCENRNFFERFCDASIAVDGDIELGNKYPFDIALDALALDENTLICRSDYTSDAVKRGFLRVIDVKQGYSACSILRLNERAVITADPTIHRALRNEGVDVLLIASGGVSLPGYECGFIGGASAVIDDKVFFFGDLSSHPDGERISEFCHENGFSVVGFSDTVLTDLGGVRYLNFPD